MLKQSFKELLNYPIPEKYLKERDGITYLPWANCVALLCELGAEKVFFEPVINPETHSSVFMTDHEFKDKNGVVNRCYEVAVKITIDDDIFEMRTPIMNGANPVKDNSLSQQRVWASQCRAFVKGVAMRTGLGFSLWTKGDLESDFGSDLSVQNIDKYLEKLQSLYTDALLTTGKSTAELAESLGINEEDVKIYFKYCRDLKQFEDKLHGVLYAA